MAKNTVTKAAVIAKVKAAKSPAEQAAERKAAKLNKNKPSKSTPDATAEEVMAIQGKSKKEKTMAAKTKQAVKKGPKMKKTAVPRTTYDPNMKITVVAKDHETREGSSVDKVWKMVSSSKTVGDYLKKRNAAKLEGMGGLFGQFVKAGFIKVGK